MQGGEVPTIKIDPQTVLLTSGQAVTFTASEPVSWSLSPPIGSLVVPGPNAAAAGPTASATYIALPLVASAQTIAVIASTASDSASATISLTPDSIAIIPAKVDLKPGDKQIFTAITAGPSGSGPSADEIVWTLSPPVGELEKGIYQAPSEVQDAGTVSVIATSPARAKQAVATINLVSPPWQGSGVQVLGAFLLLVFSLVFLIIGLWPPALPSPEIAKANRIEAESTLDNAQDKLETAQKNATTGAGNNSSTPSGTPSDKLAQPATNQQADSASEKVADLKKRVEAVRQDLQHKREIEQKVNDAYVDTKLCRINRELDLLWLVLLAGALGSFLHTAQSYSDYIGNRTLKSSWAWWYSLRPFIGAGLALVFYAAVRGGVMAVTTGTDTKASELNPFGIVSVAAMVGMFSKAATQKLGEVFDTLFKSDTAKQAKDKLSGTTNSSQPAKPASDTTTTGTSK
jgi:hypothetical protein